MSYTPFSDHVFPIFVFYIVLIVLFSFLTIKMFLKWRERKVPAPLYMTLVFAILTIGLIAATIGLGEGVITRYYKEIYRFSLPFAYTTIIFADIFLFRFVIEITEKDKRGIIPVLVVGIIIIMLLFLPFNWWGVPDEDHIGQLNTRLYVTLSLVLYSWLIFINIAIICRKTMAGNVDKIVYTGLKLLFYAVIGMIGFFVMFVADTILIVLTDHPGYSIFVYLAWVFAVGFYTFAYLSLIMPDWLVKRINKESS